MVTNQEIHVLASPWYQWLERRFGPDVAYRIIRETSQHAVDIHRQTS